MSRSTTKWILGYGLGLWFLGVVVASGRGWISSLSPYVIALIIALSMIVPVTVYFLFPAIRSAVSSSGLRILTAFHIWRIAAAGAFFWYGAHNLLPATFVHRAGWGDFAAGVMALWVITLWARPSGYWLMHSVGIIDFFSAVGTGLAFTLANQAGMRAVTEFPLALIPFFGVGLSGFAHVVAFDLLVKGQRPSQTYPLGHVRHRA